MCPVLARIPRTVTESLDNEYACIADVARALVTVRDPETRCKQRLEASTACKPRT